MLRKCNTYRKVSESPYSAPDASPLPKIGINDTKPFKFDGVDFTGALHVCDKNGKGSKEYVCLFRSVHPLETYILR